MKKSLLILIAVLVVLILLPKLENVVLAQAGGTGGAIQGVSGCEFRHNTQQLQKFGCTINTNNCTFENEGTNCMFCCTIDKVLTVVDWIFFGLMVVSIILGLLGAFSILTSGGDEGKIKTGRGRILYAIVGVGLALIAKSIPYIVSGFLK